MLIDITPESFPNFQVTILEKREMLLVFLEWCKSFHRTRSYETVYVYGYSANEKVLKINIWLMKFRCLLS